MNGAKQEIEKIWRVRNSCFSWKSSTEQALVDPFIDFRHQSSPRV